MYFNRAKSQNPEYTDRTKVFQNIVRHPSSMNFTLRAENRKV